MIPLFEPFDPGAVCVTCATHRVTQGQLLGDAQVLAAAIGQQANAATALINLCSDRYQYLKVFTAAMLRSIPMLMPPARVEATVAALVTRYPGAITISDDDSGQFDATTFTDTMPDSRVPSFAPGQLAAIAFTSGTTGTPQPHNKYWGTLAGTAVRLAGRFALNPGQRIVATVPSQHMYGMEMSILMALQGNCHITSAQPFYPNDLDAALREQRRNVLITTPVHLRALVGAGLSYVNTDLIVSATAPLSDDLAKAAETAFDCEVHEIYGCTEGGSIATRRTINGPLWSLLADMQLRDAGEDTYLEAPHLPQAVRLEDSLHLADGGFELRGRHQDMLNVAGKRFSLSELNLHLTDIEGVADAVAFLPTGERRIERPVALVVSQLSSREIAATLAKRIDAAFIPRPIVHVDHIPRNDTGKVSRDTLLSLYQSR